MCPQGSHGWVRAVVVYNGKPEVSPGLSVFTYASCGTARLVATSPKFQAPESSDRTHPPPSEHAFDTWFNRAGRLRPLARLASIGTMRSSNVLCRIPKTASAPSPGYGTRIQD